MQLHVQSFITVVTLESYITKTRLFKYIENFNTKNLKFSDKNSDILPNLLKT